MKKISDAYLKQQQELHENPNYGVASTHFAPLLATQIIPALQIETISDYGAGKCRLLNALRSEGFSPRKYSPYDPAFPEYGNAEPADLVCCIDVLEHAEPEFVDNIIRDIARITVKYGFFSIHMGAAEKFLSDGRNAHLIQRPSSWWLEKLIKHFEIMHLQQHDYMGAGLWMVVRPR